MATTHEALQIGAIVPSFTLDDLQKSMTFYEALGFVISFDVLMLAVIFHWRV